MGKKGIVRNRLSPIPERAELRMRRRSLQITTRQLDSEAGVGQFTTQRFEHSSDPLGERARQVFDQLMATLDRLEQAHRNYGRLMRLYRWAYDLNRGEAAAMFGLSRDTITHLEAGRHSRMPPDWVREKLDRVFDEWEAVRPMTDEQARALKAAEEHQRLTEEAARRSAMSALADAVESFERAKARVEAAKARLQSLAA
jgi:DNA-binding XRE family transcriptional regulator